MWQKVVLVIERKKLKFKAKGRESAIFFETEYLLSGLNILEQLELKLGC